MADRNRKVQLGARVTSSTRERAVAAAKAAGDSLNEWVEKAILAMVGDIETPIVPHPGQITLIAEDPTGLVDTADGVAPYDARPDADVRLFDPACRNRAYHWKQGPGTPCRFCGGEA